MKLQGKFALFNALSKIAFVLLFLLMMPFILERINIIQTDNDLIDKRERIIDLISEFGVEPFIGVQENSFGSYNILKEEYISLEQANLEEYWNFIEVTTRLVEDEIIDYRVLNYSFYVDDEMYLLEIGKSLSSIKQTEINIRWIALILLLVFIATTLILDISYFKILFKPLEQIIQLKINKVNDPELFDFKRIDTTTEDFQTLDLTINNMMKRIQVLFKKEREFTSNVSHELLTPVSILQSKLENLLNDSSVSGEAQVKIGDSLRTISRLKGIVNSLLLIARIENEQYIKNEEVDISELILEVTGELSDQFEAYGIILEHKLPEKITIRNANRPLLYTMFINLYGNALKYTEKKGAVLTSHSYNNGGHLIEIHNTGEGIDPNHLPEIFSRFKKFSSENIQGYGLGLPIAKTIAEFHGIKLSVNSAPGEGTSFFIQL